MPTVDYGKYQVSDSRLRDVLKRIEDETGRLVRITSGDRNFRPKGGARKSLHMIKQGSDFHIDGLPDEQAFAQLRSKRREIFGDAKGDNFRFQVIWHGANTETQGEHIHVGIVPESDKTTLRGFIVEGLTPATRSIYDVIGVP